MDVGINGLAFSCVYMPIVTYLTGLALSGAATLACMYVYERGRGVGEGTSLKG